MRKTKAGLAAVLITLNQLEAMGQAELATCEQAVQAEYRVHAEKHRQLNQKCAELKLQQAAFEAEQAALEQMRSTMEQEKAVYEEKRARFETEQRLGKKRKRISCILGFLCGATAVALALLLLSQYAIGDLWAFL